MPTSKILIVEDDVLAALFLQRILSSLGYNVVGSAATGDEAVQQAGEKRPDLVLMDVCLPGRLDGIDAAQQISAQFHIPFVYITVGADSDTIERMKQTNPAGYLPKPVNASMLQITIHSALQTHKLKEDLHRSQRLLQSTFATLHDALFIIDAETIQIKDCNPAACTIFGYTREEIVGRTPAFLYADEVDRQEFASHLFAVGEQGYFHIPEFHMKRKDGTVFPTEHSVMPLDDEQGHRIGWVGVVRDITEHKETKEKLSHSLERLDLATRAARMGIWDWDIVRDELKWDDRMYELYGIRREDFEGAYEAFLAGVHPEDRAQVNTLVQRSLRSELEYDTRFRVLWPDGTVRVLQAHGQIVKDASGNPVRMTGVNYDITEQERAVEALRESEARFRLAAEAAGIGAYAWSFQTGECYWSPEFLAIYGLNPDKPLVIDNWIPAAVHPDDRERVMAETLNLVEQQHSHTFNIEHRIIRPDGEVRWVLMKGRMEFDRQAQPSRAYGILLDETERKQAEAALRESELRFQEIADNIPGVVYQFRIDPDGTFSVPYMSQRGADFLGLSQAQLASKPPAFDTVHPEDLPEFLGSIADAAKDTRQWNHVFRNLKADGQVTWLQGSSNPHPQPDGSILWYGAMIDITTQKQMGHTLRESEERYRTLFNQSAEGIYLHRRDGQIVDVNEMACKQSGYSRDELLQLTIFDLHPDSKPSVNMPKDEILRLWSIWPAGERVSVEAMHRNRDGSLMPVHISSGVIRIGDQDLMLAMVHDITERKQAEEALRESEERYRTIFDSAPLGIFRSTFEGRFLAVNPALATMLGYDSPESVIQEIHSISKQIYIEPAQRDMIVESQIQAENVTHHLNRYRRRDGTEFVANLYLRTVHDANGTPMFLQGIVEDITEHRRAEQARQESEERYRAIFENALMAILLIQDGKFIYGNPASARMLGYANPSDIVGMDAMRAIAPEFHDAIHQRMQLLGDRQLNPPLEMQIVHPDGARRWSLSTSVSIQIGGRPTTVIMGQDITDRKQAEAELRQQERLAAVGALAGGIAHDFNNLLATIILYDHLALNHRRELPDSVVTALETILLETKRASSLVQQILDFSRRAVLEIAPLDLVRFIPQILRVLRPTIPENIGLAFDTSCAQCMVQADITRVEQALINLTVNARDAMPDGGELRISISTVTIKPYQTVPIPGLAVGEWACLQVGDTGTGMPQEVRLHLFEPFFTTKAPGKGTGLGLSQVYGIVKQHHGHIGVDSTLGKGTTFTIYLPLTKDETAEDSETVPGTDFLKGHGELILLVEDQKYLRKATGEFLTSLGYHVMAAPDGWEALLFAQKEHVDLLLTDVVMPKLGGVELLRRIRETYPELKAIAVTGYVLDQEFEALRNAGFDATLAKPFDLQELSATLRSVLDGSEAPPNQ